MANRLAFQTQLASIMEVLANAAVAEICKLVDDDYAVINLQMSQCQRENKALKRKLHLLELRMARGYAERRIRENSLNRTSRVHVNAALSEKYSANAADVFQNQGDLYRRQLNEQVWREGESSGADVVIDPVIKDDVNGPGDSSPSRVGPAAVLVKAETADENHAQQQLFIREDGVPEAVCEAAEADYGAPPADKADAQRSRTRHQALEVSGSDTVLKCEPRFVSAEGASQEPVGGEGEFVVSGECAPLEELFVQGGDREDAPRPSCSYMDQHKPEIIEVESAEEGDALSAWDANVVLARHKALQRYPDRADRSDHFNAPVPGLTRLPADFPAVASTSASDGWQQPKGVAQHQARGGAYRPRNDKVGSEKLFACKFCGKAFNRPKKVEIHQRIHTGEKPFRCSTCGKFFAEAGNLKKHQKVHTGERPYSCSQCGKSFAWIRNLKTHQQKYHPDFFMAEELMSMGAIKN